MDLKGNDNLIPNSWRFWAKGVSKETPICGIIRDSSDSIGRNYPFLVIGTGYLKNWEEQWDLLPFACEKTWNQIEYISAQKFSDLKKLETEIQNIRPPDSGWPELKLKREESMKCEGNPGAGTFYWDPGELIKQGSYLSEESGTFIPLDQETCYDQSTLISHWHLLLKNHAKTIPNSTFMGGTFSKLFLTFFNRPLSPADFIKLWTASLPEG